MQIRAEIAEGRLVPGQRLNETTIAKTLGVSRGPVREAVQSLKAEGLVREEPHRGCFVVSLSPEDVAEIFEVRLAVETRAAKLIMRRHNAHDLTALEQRARAVIEAAAKGDEAQVARADVQFHETICRLSGVARLQAIFSQHVGLFRSLLLIDERLYPVVADLTDEHYEIFRGIQSGDEAAAIATLESHLERSKERLVGHLRAQPAMKDPPEPD